LSAGKQIATTDFEEDVQKIGIPAEKRSGGL
jgi:hypothetical protein